MKIKNIPVMQTPRQEVFEARRMQANQYNVWTPETFARMVDRICNEEINAMMQFGHPAPDDEDREDLRSIAIQNINAYAVPAGNA